MALRLTRALSSSGPRDVLVLNGDGVGNEIISAARAMVDAVAPSINQPIRWVEADGCVIIALVAV